MRLRFAEYFNKLVALIVTRILLMRSKYELNQIRKLPSTTISSDLRFGEGSSFHIHGKYKSLNIGGGVNFRKLCNVLVFSDATLIIGDGVFFNNYCSINCLDHIEIGRNTLFGEGVKIYDHNHGYSFDDNASLHIEGESFKTAPVRIGSNCWIGSNVTILKGVEIGDNVIIGAHCLIYKSVAANTIVKSVQNLEITDFGMRQ